MTADIVSKLTNQPANQRVARANKGGEILKRNSVVSRKGWRLWFCKVKSKFLRIRNFLMSHSQFCFLHTQTQFKKISPCAADKMLFMSLAACYLQLPLIQIGGSHHYWSVWLADCPCHPPHPVVLHIQLAFISSQENVTHRSKTPKRVLTFFCGDLDTSFCTSVTLAAFAFLFSSTLKMRSSSNSWCLKLKFHNDSIICLHFHIDCSQ